MPKRTITEGDYYKLLGLLAVAQDHYRAIDAIKEAVASIVGEEEDRYGFYGLSDDAVTGEYDARGLLRALEIEVEA